VGKVLRHCSIADPERLLPNAIPCYVFEFVALMQSDYVAWKIGQRINTAISAWYIHAMHAGAAAVHGKP
jgi:hypothetical protein